MELTFVETQKTAKKTQKTIYSLNNEKTMKASFYCSQKSGFWEHRKHKKQKHTLFLEQVFCVFCFQEQKIVLENRNQTSLMLLETQIYEIWDPTINGQNNIENVHHVPFTFPLPILPPNFFMSSTSPLHVNRTIWNLN